MYIRKDDVVEVVAGDDKGTRGKVLRVLRAKNQLVVEGVNRVYRHLKPSKRNPQGGRLSTEMPVDASNATIPAPSPPTFTSTFPPSTRGDPADPNHPFGDRNF